MSTFVAHGVKNIDLKHEEFRYHCGKAMRDAAGTAAPHFPMSLLEMENNWPFLALAKKHEAAMRPLPEEYQCATQCPYFGVHASMVP